jgi:hypothetical protein
MTSGSERTLPRESDMIVSRADSGGISASGGRRFASADSCFSVMGGIPRLLAAGDFAGRSSKALFRIAASSSGESGAGLESLRPPGLP